MGDDGDSVRTHCIQHVHQNSGGRYPVDVEIAVNGYLLALPRGPRQPRGRRGQTLHVLRRLEVVKAGVEPGSGGLQGRQTAGNEDLRYR